MQHKLPVLKVWKPLFLMCCHYSNKKFLTRRQPGACCQSAAEDQVRWFRMVRSGLVEPFASAEECASALCGIQVRLEFSFLLHACCLGEIIVFSL